MFWRSTTTSWRWFGNKANIVFVQRTVSNQIIMSEYCEPDGTYFWQLIETLYLAVNIRGSANWPCPSQLTHFLLPWLLLSVQTDIPKGHTISHHIFVPPLLCTRPVIQRNVLPRDWQARGLLSAITIWAYVWCFMVPCSP